MKHLLIVMEVVLAVVFFEQMIQVVVASDTELKDSNGTSVFDDRINLFHGVSHAHASNQGGSSVSDTISYGYNAGILYPGGNYRPIGSQSGSKSNSYASGKRPPSTYSKGGVESGRNGIKGNTEAGYSGGQGSAFSNSHSQQVAVPLGFGGAVILSNLHRPNETTNNTANADEDKVNPSPANETSSNNRFVFA